jgi:hypothetical protein
MGATTSSGAESTWPGPRVRPIRARNHHWKWWHPLWLSTRASIARASPSPSAQREHWTVRLRQPSWVPLLPVRRCRVPRGYFQVPAGTYPAPDALARKWRRARGQRAHLCSTREVAGTRGDRAVPARHGVSARGFGTGFRHGVSARGFRRCPRQTRKASSLSHEDSFTSRKLPRLV